MPQAPRQYWVHGELYKAKHPPYWQYAGDYEDKQPKRSKEVWDSTKPYVCPHCSGNSARLQQENHDLYCFICGWRESQFFNPRFQKWLNWLEMNERKHGYEPQLRSDKEEKKRLEANRWMQEHRDTQKEHDYNISHRKEKAAYARSYRQKHAEKLHDYVANYREQNRDRINEYHRNRSAKKREAVKV